MSLKSKTIWFPMRRWFPPNDQIARGIARLCVLREDLYIDYLGMAAESPLSAIMPSKQAPHPSLDDNGEPWRRLYFFRNAIKTLYEIKNALSALHDNRQFRRMLRNADQHCGSEFLSYLQMLDRQLDDLKRLRHALGGHVSREAVKQAFEIMDFDAIGTIEVGKLEKDTHFCFVHPLCVRMFFIGVDLSAADKYLAEIFGLLLPTLNIIAHLVGIYASERKLM
jgi:hypothetical protein